MTNRRAGGEGGICKRSDGRWCATLDLGIVGGRRKKKYIYARTRKEVADKLRAAQVALAKGVNIGARHQTVEQFLNQWLELKKARIQPRTHESYAYIVQKYLIPHLGAHRLDKLSPQHIDAMLQEIVRAGKLVGRDQRREDFAPRTPQYVRLVLSRALNQAVKWGLLPRNVAALVDDVLPPSRDRVVPLTVEQARALLGAVKGHRLDGLYRVALSLGMRRGEILAIRWQDIDFEKRTLRVEQSLQRQNGRLEMTAPKTKRSRRVIPLPEKLAHVLREHQERKNIEQENTPDWQDHGLVFPSSRGTPMEPRSLLRHFKQLLKQAGLPETTRFHDLRHSAATFMLAQGVALPVISKTLGHTTTQVTADIYAHVLPDLERDATKRVDALFDDDDEG